MFGSRWVRAHHELTPISHPAVAGPYFLTIDDIVSILKPGFGLQRGKVRSRIRFGKTLAPNLFRAENLRNEALFLSAGSVSDDRWADQAQTESIGHRRGFKTRHFFPEHRLLHQCGAAATIFFGPGNCRPTAFMKFSLPGPQVREGFLQRLFAPFGPVLGNVGLQPGAELVAKGEVFRSEVQIHFFLRSFVFTAQRGLVVSRSLLRRSLRRTTPRL